jgi:CelD/BcsL family acetyltransferase involved in cellulose biosynthesis
MKVNYIDNLAQLDELKSNWEEVYQADPNANFLVSWVWLRCWLEFKPEPWFILAVFSENHSSYVAFLPLGKRVIQKYGLKLLSDLHMGGKHSSDYTGFVCLPEYEQEAIEALADYVQKKVDWERFKLSDVLDPRLDLFLNHFTSSQFWVRKEVGKASAYITLPLDWDDYLYKSISKKARSNLRRAFRKIEASDRFKFTYSDSHDLDSLIEALLNLNQMRFGQRSPSELNMYHHIFRHCFQHNCLWAFVLWDGETPISASLGLIDSQKGAFFGYLMGYHPDYKYLEPGKAVCVKSIQYAIEQGLKVYDFGGGDFDFKYFLGGTKRFNINGTIFRKNLRAFGFSLGLKILKRLKPQS